MKTLKILLIEDDESFNYYLRELLQEYRGHFPIFEIECVKRLSMGMDRIGVGDIDGVLLDLYLPDSKGIDTLKALINKTLQIPIIVVTELSDEKTAIEAVKVGAQDYLVKSNINTDILMRSLWYSVERKRAEVNKDNENSKRIKSLEKELQSYKQSFDSKLNTVTTEFVGIKSFKDSLPETFSEAVNLFEEVLELSMQKRIFRTEADISEKLHMIADEIGFFKGGPKDVMDIYNTSMAKKTQSTTREKNQIYFEEGRLLVLQLMGYLAMYYRRNPT